MIYGRGLIREEVGGAFKTYHFDCRGIPVAITNAAGSITEPFLGCSFRKIVQRLQVKGKKKAALYAIMARKQGARLWTGNRMLKNE